MFGSIATESCDSAFAAKYGTIHYRTRVHSDNCKFHRCDIGSPRPLSCSILPMEDLWVQEIGVPTGLGLCSRCIEVLRQNTDSYFR